MDSKIKVKREEENQSVVGPRSLIPAPELFSFALVREFLVHLDETNRFTDETQLSFIRDR
jgi:hypothetical protein